MAQLFYDSDADVDLIYDKSVVIIGYGAEGHAHALNLIDCGVVVIVGLCLIFLEMMRDRFQQKHNVIHYTVYF